MTKTLSFKTTDEIYSFVHKLPGGHSVHLRRAQDEYLEKHYSYKKNSQQKGSIPMVYPKSGDDEGNDSNDDSIIGIHSIIDNLEDMKDKNKS